MFKCRVLTDFIVGSVFLAMTCSVAYGNLDNDNSTSINHKGYSIAVDFEPTTADFLNPERGFLGHGEYLDQFNDDFLEWRTSQNYRLIYAYGKLEDFRNRDISDEYLKNTRHSFELARKYGVKFVLRFAYNEERHSKDASLSWVKRHIEQLTPVLRENADVIALVQAGFIGAWGEWHRSTNDLDNAINEKKIVDKLLLAIPESRQIAVRYPREVWRMYKQLPKVKDLSLLSQPFSTRIGLHNDCFLASSDDYGTYPGTSEESEFWRFYAQKITDITSFGGQTCIPKKGARMRCDDLLREGRDYHVTYLDNVYHRDFISGWKTQGCLSEVSKRLGYRFVLDNFRLKQVWPDNLQMRWEVTLKNEGWARPINSRFLVLRLQEMDGGRTIDRALSGTNLRLVGPGDSLTISGVVNLPSNLGTEHYRILLGAPDPAPTLSNDPRYSIRFANADRPEKNQRWLSEQGFMDLGEQFALQ